MVGNDTGKVKPPANSPLVPVPTMIANPSPNLELLPGKYFKVLDGRTVSTIDPLSVFARKL